MPKLILCLFCAAFAALLTGCSSTMRSVTASAGGKNLNLDGYLMFGELETEVPTAGYFKSTKTKSLFGTEEHIIEYDFTAGSDADAEKALKLLEEKRRAAEEQEKAELRPAWNKKFIFLLCPASAGLFFYLVKTIFYFLPYSFAEGFNSRPQQCENRFPFAAKTSSYNISACGILGGLDGREIPLPRVLNARETESCGNRAPHEYALCPVGRP